MKPLKLAIQKSGRLSDDSLALLKTCGIHFNNGIGKLRTEALNFPLELYFLRDDDIPQYVTDGIADLGIVGENVLYEKEQQLPIAAKLGFGRCRLSLAVPKNSGYRQLADLNGQRIATSYPRLLGTFLDANGLKAELHEINGLREVETVLESQAVLVRAQRLSVEKEVLLNRLLFRIQAVQKAQKNKYILLNAPNDRLEKIISLLPGIKSPTILPLAVEGWSSLHSVIEENQFWEVIEQLKVAGAEGILVLPIEKMIF
jgi:ATP phosphoribosyltransferase